VFTGLQSSAAGVDIPRMIWFFESGDDRRACEVRLREDGPGYELVIQEGASQRVEHFDELGPLLTRERAVIASWKALGFRDLSAPEG
jgi:hypothetical protein